MLLHLSQSFQFFATTFGSFNEKSLWRMATIASTWNNVHYQMVCRSLLMSIKFYNGVNNFRTQYLRCKQKTLKSKHKFISKITVKLSPHAIGLSIININSFLWLPCHRSSSCSNHKYITACLLHKRLCLTGFLIVRRHENT